MSGVSHSRVESFLACHRKEFYSYYRKLEKIQKSTALAYGSFGHLMLQTLYSTVLAEGNSKAAQKSAYASAVCRMWDVFNAAVESGEWVDPEGRAPLRLVLERYLQQEPFIDNAWQGENTPQWQILAVEKEFNLEWNPETGESYPFVIDMIVRDPEGKLAVVDHKFLYDLYRDKDAELMPQIPKYIGALRALNYQGVANYGLYNMLRTRPDTKAGRPLYEWAFCLEVPVSPTRVRRTFEEQIENAMEVHELDQLSPEDRDRKAVRVGNDKICGYCDFRELCVEELRGGNVALLLSSVYQPKTKRAHIEVSAEVEA